MTSIECHEIYLRMYICMTLSPGSMETLVSVTRHENAIRALSPQGAL